MRGAAALREHPRFRFATPEVRRDGETLVVFVGRSTWAPWVAHEPSVMFSTLSGVLYFVPSLFVITVLAALALRMSVTRLPLAYLAAELLWVAAAAAIAFRSASTRLAAPVIVSAHEWSRTDHSALAAAASDARHPASAPRALARTPIALAADRSHGSTDDQRPARLPTTSAFMVIESNSPRVLSRTCETLPHR